MSFLMTFLEGLASFISPCLLPLLPVYVAYFAGEGEKQTATRLFALSLAFVIGFSLVFITLGVFAGSLGKALSAHGKVVDLACGAMVVAFGLGYLGLFRLPFSGVNKSCRMDGLLSAFLFGFVYSVNLTPCVGAFLGSALMTAASEGGAVKGALLLTAYSCGLGIPFVLSAMMIGRLGAAFGFIKRNYRVINPICGVVLVLFGLWTIARPFLAKDVAPRQDAPAAKVETTATSPREGATTELEVTVTGANFEEEVIRAKKPVLVDFWAPWCGPCRMLGPHVAELAHEMSATIKVCKINVDDAQDLAMKFDVRGIPALFIFKDGKVVARSVGYMQKDSLSDFVNSNIK